jgi:hypothetical protein
MVATPISASTRYINVGTTVVYWVPSISNKAAPTRTELNLGTNLVNENSAADGWKTTTDSGRDADHGEPLHREDPRPDLADDSR